MNTPSVSEQIEQLTDDFYWPADKFFPYYAPEALTYKEVSLATHHSSILPNQTDTTSWLTERIALSTPLISADMDTVTEHKMAIAMALEGGIGMIHANLSHEQKKKEVQKVKHYQHGIIDKPITILPDMTIGQVLELIDEKGYKFSTFPVLDNGKLVGLLGGSVVGERFKNSKVSEHMKKASDLKTLSETELGENPLKIADIFFTENPGVNKLLISSKNQEFKGLITEKDITRLIREDNSNSFIKPTRDNQKRLRVGATVKADFYQTDSGKRNIDVNTLIEEVGELVDAGLDIVAVSTAHGWTDGVGDSVATIREHFPELDIMAGNVTNPGGVEFLKNKGANVVKVGQGPGSICTTREQTGVGIPQMTAVYTCSKAAQIIGGVKIIADGGSTASGDMVKALTLADSVMLGSMLAGSEESPGEIYELNGVIFKTYRGMGSIEAMQAGSADRYGQSDARKLSPEGINAMKESIGPVNFAIQLYRGSIQSGLGYHGARNIAELQEKARFVKMNPAGQIESAPHDVIPVNKA